jgi:hypothetical protein
MLSSRLAVGRCGFFAAMRNTSLNNQYERLVIRHSWVPGRGEPGAVDGPQPSWVTNG